LRGEPGPPDPGRHAGLQGHAAGDHAAHRHRTGPVGSDRGQVRDSGRGRVLVDESAGSGPDAAVDLVRALTPASTVYQGKEDTMARSTRFVLENQQGVTRHNFNWDAINIDTAVVVTAAEYADWLGALSGVKTVGRPNLG